MRILVVEDNPANRELIREILESSGHDVVEAENGQVALDTLAKEVPPVALIDIQMPVMDGLTLLARIRSNPALVGIKTVALTAFAMQGDPERLLQAGFDAYLSKPVDMIKLEEEIQRLTAE